MQVSELHVGQTAKILALGKGNLAYRQRLIAMGLIPGTTFKVVRMAPLGDPIEILVRGAALSLRKHEANILQITEVR
jgi:Fe2+ transport system protein FeoA